MFAAIIREEPGAFDAFYERFAPILYSLGLRWLQHPNDAEELVSETLVRAWRNADRFDPARGAVASWIFGIAQNIARDRWRARQRSSTLPLPEASGGPTSPESTDGLLAAIDVGVALARLTPEHRDVLILTYAHRATESEIAEQIGIPSGTVKSRRFYALRELGRHLEAPNTSDERYREPGREVHG